MKQLLFLALVGFALVFADEACRHIVSADGASRYDLSWFMAQSTHGPLKGTTGGDTYEYEFEVCGPGFECGLSACTGLAPKGGSCQSWGDFMSKDSEACLGANVPSAIVGLNNGEGVTLTYANGDEYKSNPRTTNLVLKCDKTQKDWGTVTFDDSKQLSLIYGYCRIRTCLPWKWWWCNYRHEHWHNPSHCYRVCNPSIFDCWYHFQ